MGTEQSYPIGTVLTRKKPEGDNRDEVRVVGGGKELIVTPNKEFGESFQIDANVARRDYNSDVGEDVLLAQPTYIDPGPTPEQVFSQDTNTERRPEASAWRTRKSDDPRTEAESSVTDTGVPVVKTHPDQPLPSPSADKKAEVEEAVKATRKAKATSKASEPKDDE